MGLSSMPVLVRGNVREEIFLEDIGQIRMERSVAPGRHLNAGSYQKKRTIWVNTPGSILGLTVEAESSFVHIYLR